MFSVILINIITVNNNIHLNRVYYNFSEVTMKNLVIQFVYSNALRLTHF